jgi:23S rRNA pseudouridine1911/1915/1917 synthase
MTFRLLLPRYTSHVHSLEGLRRSQSWIKNGSALIHTQQRQRSTLLQPPSILYSDNHLLVVNKPVGWHSVPNDPGKEISEKCILSHLQRNSYGGGSFKDFLLPLHRLDQPCSGVLMFGKTSKAASRITKLWKQKLVIKDYLCVVAEDKLASLQQASTSSGAGPSPSEQDGWHHLSGILQPRPSKTTRSVVIIPQEQSLLYSSSSGRPVHVSWRLVNQHSSSTKGLLYRLVQVQTNLGARHMVRALLAQVGKCPIVGDLRYARDLGAPPLEDQSVALHAYRVRLPPQLKLGSVETFEFVAPIPTTWQEYFWISESGVVVK